MPADFMIIGAQKCGTTSLAAQIAAHPAVSFCREKEPHFFSTRRDWRSATEEYDAMWDDRPGALRGEASTSYTFLPEHGDVAGRLHEYNPRLRLIYIVRHPVDRIVSHYAHDFIRAYTRRPPAEQVLRDPMYINRSRYALQLRPYLERFPREQIAILLFDDYTADPRGTLRAVARHLSVADEPFDRVDLSPRTVSARTGFFRNFPGSRTARRLLDGAPAPIRRVGEKALVRRIEEKPVFPEELRALLWRFVEDDVKALEEILGRSLDVWRDR